MRLWARGAAPRTHADLIVVTTMLTPALSLSLSLLPFLCFSHLRLLPLAHAGWTCSGCKSDALAAYTAHPAFVGIFATMLAMFLSGLAVMRHGMH